MNTYFLFSDIHGNYDAFMKAIEKSGFDENNEHHYLVGLGDYFDRRKQNHLVLEYLFRLDKINKIYLIRGNHDDFLLDVITSKKDDKAYAYYYGLDKTIENLSGLSIYEFYENQEKYVSLINKKYPTLVSFLEKMSDHFVIGNYMLTHAGRTYKNGYWQIYNMSNIVDFITKYPFDDYKEVFGHVSAHILNKHFMDKKSDEPFFISSL